MTEIVPRIKPRVILELDDTSGEIFMERYINGQRERTLVPEWDVPITILRALNDQKRRNDEDAERRRKQKEDEAKKLHTRVWTNTAYDHGVAFANRTVGPITVRNARTDKIQASEDLL